MSQENVEVVRRCFDDYLRGAPDEALAWLAPDVVWEVGQELPARGPDAVRDLWERWESDWEGLEMAREEFIDVGDQVVVTVHYSGRGRGSGVPFDDRLFDVYTLREGKIIRKREFRDRSAALAAAGADE
jgi:ketosteroid isomerase-like protein